MKLDVNFANLRALADKLGAAKTDFSLVGPSLEQLEEVYLKLKEGVEVDIDEVEPNALQLLTYQGHHVLLYIRDHGSGFWAATEDPDRGHKFHICDCSTLQNMRSQDRFERYVATNDTSGTFLISGRNYHGGEVEKRVRLLVCLNCVRALNYKRARRMTSAQRQNLARNFRLDEFFATYSTAFRYLPGMATHAGSEPRYSADWDAVCRNHREKVGYRCEKCGIDLSSSPALLHVHHQNGDRRNNRPENLKGLCIDCHAKVHGDPPIFVSRREREVIARLRAAARRTKQASPRSQSRKASWKEVYELADASLHGVLDQLETENWLAPEVDWEIEHEGRVFARVELAWPTHRLAVVLEETAETEGLREMGWTVKLPRELL